ncbi:MAG: hypothetical protein NXI04_11755 [Planctomycetaceae bacterium]|nr:hypothetical protein [Planctomycetaceae bacterium]
MKKDHEPTAAAEPSVGAQREDGSEETEWRPGWLVRWLMNLLVVGLCGFCLYAIAILLIVFVFNGGR